MPRKFQRAARICDGLGTYGIEYIEDPDSPISEIMGRTEVVDAVCFPRKTLFIHSEDCDDTAALLASLMESAGIRTNRVRELYARVKEEAPVLVLRYSCLGEPGKSEGAVKRVGRAQSEPRFLWSVDP